MAATLVIFRTAEERAMMCACSDHGEEEKLFGTETQKLLDTCYELFRVSINFRGKAAEDPLLKKIYGIAKAHHLFITWYGRGNGLCQPDRFLISGRGERELAFIQC